MNIAAACEAKGSTLLSDRRTVVLGITHPQTCLVLGPRLRTLREAGFRVVLIGSPGELLLQTAQREGVEYRPLRIERSIAPLADLVSLLKLIYLLRRLRPDITEFSTPKAGLLGALASTLCRVPRRIYALRGLRLETTTGWKRRLLLFAERLTCACSHHVLCNSQSLREQALRLGVTSAGKIRLIGDGSSFGVDMDRFAPGRDNLRGSLGWPQDACVIGFVGRLTRDKGVPELLQAFDTIAAAEPRARLLLVGWYDRSDDALAGIYRARIETDPRIHCTGFVHDTAPFYSAMDVMVLPTWREGFPNVVLEAQSSGVPVITTLSTGARDSIVPEVTGLLIPPGYPEAISEAVLSLLRDPARRLSMGRAARVWVQQHYADRHVMELMSEFYRELVDAGSKRPQTRMESSLVS